MSDWKKLEEWTAKLLEEDRGKIPRNSGGTKKEEDVVGTSSIAQCKATDQINITILNKDTQRLLKAAELQDKFPFFITSTFGRKSITMILDGNNDEIITSLVKIATIRKGAEKLLKVLKSQDINIRHIYIARSELKKLKRRFAIEVDTIKTLFSSIDSRCNTLYDDLTIMDLFEGEKNGS